VGAVAKVICPRCGSEGILEIFNVNGRQYLRVVHYYYDVKKKRRKRLCYIGPVDEYEYVNRLHLLGVTNLKDSDPSKIVENVVNTFIGIAVRKVLRNQLTDDESIAFVRKAKALLSTLDECRKRVEGLLKDMQKL